MLKKLLLLILAGVASAQAAPLDKLATAIARTEGFYVKNSIAARTHNPGDLRSHKLHVYPGQVGLYKGYVVFRSDKWGWLALIRQVQRMVDGTSKIYNSNMTFQQVASHYAENSRRWGESVCKILGIPTRMTLAEYMFIRSFANVYQGSFNRMFDVRYLVGTGR